MPDSTNYPWDIELYMREETNRLIRSFRIPPRLLGIPTVWGCENETPPSGPLTLAMLVEAARVIDEISQRDRLEQLAALARISQEFSDSLSGFNSPDRLAEAICEEHTPQTEETELPRKERYGAWLKRSAAMIESQRAKQE